MILDELQERSWLLTAARKSNFAFARVICDRDRLRDEHLVWDQLVDERQGLYLMPRGSLKTTLFAESYPTKRILDDPESRGLIITESYKPHAQQRIRAVKKYLESNAAEVYCPGIHDRIKRAEVWTESAICLPTATGKRKSKEYNLIACGIDQPQTGGHYDYIIGDDLVNEKDRGSETVRATKKEWLPSLFYLGEKDAQVIFVGTRWHPDDLYATLMQTYPEFVVYKQSIYNADGSTWLPETYTPEEIMRHQRTPILFSHQYLNEAIAGEDKRIDLEWFKDAPMLPRKDYILVTAGVDPAFGEKDQKDLCFKAAAVWGVDKDMRVWLLGGAMTRESLPYFKENELRTLYRQLQPGHIRVEDNGPQKGAALYFQTDKEYGRVVTGTDADMAKDKVGRAQGWLEYAETYGIFTVKGAYWDEASYQLANFPLVKDKDFPDAMSCAWPDVNKLVFRPSGGVFKTIPRPVLDPAYA